PGRSRPDPRLYGRAPSRPSPTSHAGFRSDATGRDRVPERAVVMLVLVGIDLRERRQGPVEGLASAEIASDRDRITGAGGRLRERSAAELRVQRHRDGVHRLDDGGALRVPVLTDVEVSMQAVQVGDAEPAQQDVARGALL